MRQAFHRSLAAITISRAKVLPIGDDLAPVKGANKGEPYKPASVSLAFRRLRTTLGIADLKLHDVRHDTAAKMRRNGIGIDVISKVRGHSNITTTMRYAHVEPEFLRAAVNSVRAPIA